MLLQNSPNILLVEDDILFGKTIQDHLERIGYRCDLVEQGAKAVESALAEDYKLIVLDLSLSDGSSLGALRCIREADENVNLLVMTPLEFRQERMAALEAGADDFILKPFQMAELEARLEAALVRARTKPKTKLEFGPLQMDLTNRRVTRDGRDSSLTPTEFRILEILMRNQGRVVTRRMLCEFLWNPEWEGVTNVIEVHINRLRSKINQKGDPQLIHTVRGSGYILKAQDLPVAANQVPMPKSALAR
ncbi:MAG: response regulator transcription factor [Planctomycetota bacterium]